MINKIFAIILLTFFLSIIIIEDGYPTVVNTILKKYNNALPAVPENNEFNRIIKLVGEKLPSLHVPFTKQVTYKRERIELIEMKYSFLQTHTARRSFCSNEY